ncbi:MAG TPA: DegV family protein [Erysipelotrichaceae bacterium]|nr:DegV family protein [Erysipelotrichaceae bacterium]
MKVAVVTDSACGMSHLNIKMDGLYMLPLQITDGENNYFEGENITNDQCYQMMFMGKHMKSSQPSFGRIQELFTDLKKEYDHIYAVPLGKGLSSTLNTMELVAKEVDVPFTGMDCYSMANIELVCAVTARQLFDQGKSIEEVDKIIRDMAEHSITLIMAEDLKLFAKNGRTTALAATIGGFLNIKPVLVIRKETEGRIDILDKLRTIHKAFHFIVDEFEKFGVNEEYEFCIGHAWSKENAELLESLIRERFPDSKLYVTDLICSGGVNAGLGCVATQAIRKPKI